MAIRFQLALLAVKSVEISKRFYQELFDQTVMLDLGKNVTFSGGFAVQEDFPWLVGLPPESAAEGSHRMELYFETEDFDAFLEKLAAHPDVERVHPPKKYEWQQRVIRIYDPDRHIIEIGESMAVIARRYLSQGCSAGETAAIIQHPVAFVEKARENS